LISNVKNIYELVRANVPSLLTDRNQIPNQISRKRKHNEE
jgi:hypothetical protein